MAAVVKPRLPEAVPLIEWRANRIADPVARLKYLRNTLRTETKPSTRVLLPRHRGRRLLLCAFLAACFLVAYYPSSKSRPPSRVPAPAVKTIAAANYPVPLVWPVENTAHFDLYSNGLRIENEFAVAGRPRAPYPVFPSGSALDQGDRRIERRSNIQGIVFHSTESHQAPFEPSEVPLLKKLGRGLLAYVRAQQSYHFVIDRFGRVFRVVAETGIANHAGKSVWSDDKGVYVNLNASFLSIAFESQTDASLRLSAAQIHAARVLTDMLRSRYGIAASNCVTHAQVSVNPFNMRIGYHTDWASGFPFAELGLPDNYAQIVPSMALFGFDYDEAFEAAAVKPWTGLIATERVLLEQARAGGLSAAVYRQHLRERYRRMVSSAHLALD